MAKSMLRGWAIMLAALLVWPVSAHAQFSDGYKFLDAVKKKNGQEVTDMLSEPGSTLINTRDITTGETALHIVVTRRDLTWVQFLISKGANVNVRDSHGVTPLVLACNLNFIEGVSALIERGARVEEANSAGETPLIAAVHNRNLELMRVLLRAGADPDRADNSGRTARDYAVLEGRSSATLGVIDRDARPRGTGQNTPQVYGPSR